MIGILLVSHGKMAEGIKDSVSMIMGDTDQFDTLSLVPGQDVADLSLQILQKSRALDSGDGILIFVDLFGASPYNASMKCLSKWATLNIQTRIITGMSLPMVITAISNRDFLSLAELAAESIDAGVDNMKDAILALHSATSPNDTDDY